MTAAEAALCATCHQNGHTVDDHPATAIPLSRGEGDALTCPIPTAETDWAYDDNDHEVRGCQLVAGTCGQALAVVVEARHDLACFDLDPTRIYGLLTDPEAWEWRVECEDGHVLARNTYDGHGGESTPSFCLAWLPFTIPPRNPS